MKTAVRNREKLGEIGAAIVDEFDALNAVTSQWSNQQHTDEGAHKAITVDGIGSNSFDRYPAIPLHAGLRFLFGPLLIDEDGNGSHHAGLRPPQIKANTDNYAPAFIDQAIALEIQSDAARNLTGIRTKRAKRLLILGNTGSFTITLKHNASSTDAYRFSFAGSADVSLLSGMYIWLFYDVNAEKWRRIS